MNYRIDMDLFVCILLMNEINGRNAMKIDMLFNVMCYAIKLTIIILTINQFNIHNHNNSIRIVCQG